MRKAFDKFRCPMGFSLAEVLAALSIGAMILVAMIGIYNRAEKSAAAITRKLDSARLPSEVIQRITEDLDGIVAAGNDTKIIIENKFDNLYANARLIIQKTIYDSENKKQTFKEIVWQGSYDYDSDTGGLVLYRSYKGVGLEDKLLDKQRRSWEKESTFVPICRGVTFFGIQVSTGKVLQAEWTNDSLPNGILVTISFAEPFKTLAGTFDVPDTEKITRTIAIDRTRKIRFIFVKKEDEKETNK
jgi:hypothetical protein